jgi:hypothetical protein
MSAFLTKTDVQNQLVFSRLRQESEIGKETFCRTTS